MAELLLRKSGQPWIEWRNGRFRHWAYRVDHWENCSAAVVLRNYGATVITRYRDGNLGLFQRFLNYSKLLYQEATIMESLPVGKHK